MLLPLELKLVPADLAGLPLDADLGGLLGADFGDQGFHINLGAALVELVDDLAQVVVDGLRRGDDQRVGHRVGLDDAVAGGAGVARAVAEGRRVAHAARWCCRWWCRGAGEAAAGAALAGALAEVAGFAADHRAQGLGHLGPRRSSGRPRGCCRRRRAGRGWRPAGAPR
jgi:hypothetical protein